MTFLKNKFNHYQMRMCFFYSLKKNDVTYVCQQVDLDMEPGHGSHGGSFFLKNRTINIFKVIQIKGKHVC